MKKTVILYCLQQFYYIVLLHCENSVFIQSHSKFVQLNFLMSVYEVPKISGFLDHVYIDLI